MKWTECSLIHTQNIISSFKTEISTHAITCMNLEDIMLREISQPGKGRYCMISLIWGQYGSHKKAETVAARGWKEGEWGDYGLMGTELQFRKMKTCSGDGWRWWQQDNVDMKLLPLNWTPNNGQSGKFYVMHILQFKQIESICTPYRNMCWKLWHRTGILL